jgi:chemotaxis protein methyltransferase CheR
VETAPAGSAPIAIADREFLLLKELILKETGIFLSETKKALVAGRLSRRLRELGMPSYGAYHDLVSAASGRPERVRMVEAICTHETRFFREPQQFRFLEERVFPEWKALAAQARRPRRVSVWSAACSSGEEPYSIAMHLLTHFPQSSGWVIDILATDLSRKVLAQAETGIWPLERSAGIPMTHLKHFMLRGTRSEAGRMKAGPELRATIRFQPVNLSTPPYQIGGRFDLVFCRNVLIYFAAASRRGVIQRIVDQHLEPSGFLLLGHAETVHDFTNQLRTVGPSVYTRIDSVGARGEG